MTTREQISITELRSLGLEACRACGASEAMAHSLVESTIAAELSGRAEVGFAHLPDYLDSLRAGRIDGAAEPVISFPRPAAIHADARLGIAQLAFDRARLALAERAMSHGIAILTVANSYTAGEIGHYVRVLARDGVVSMAFANAHAMVATAPGVPPVYGTNPLAFGAPMPPPSPPLVFDQSTSATAFVNVARAAAGGRPIPEGWAVDAARRPTTDASAAVAGALLPFGGFKGANMALMVEVLSAGLAGAAWSLDAGHFRQGARSPSIGLTVIAIAPADPDFAGRLSQSAERLSSLGVHVPGQRARLTMPDIETLEIDAAALATIHAAAAQQ